MGERIELTENELKKVAKYMSQEMKDNLDAHVAESLEAHSIRIDLKWEEKVDKYNKEIYTALYQQQCIIDKVDKKADIALQRIDILEKNKSVYYFPRNILKISFWTTFISSIIAIIYLLWKQLSQ